MFGASGPCSLVVDCCAKRCPNTHLCVCTSAASSETEVRKNIKYKNMTQRWKHCSETTRTLSHDAPQLQFAVATATECNTATPRHNHS